MLTAGTDAFTYDGNGNQVSHLQGTALTTYSYDFNNRLITESSPAGTETSQYAPDGSRVDLHGPNADPGNAAGEVGPQYDTIGNPILDMTTANAVNVYRVYGPGIDEPLAEWRAGNTQTSYLLHDALNSVTAVTTSQGAVAYRQSFRAFGARTQTQLPTGMVSTRLSYTSRENALGSLMFNRARFYDTASGRFQSQDTERGQETRPPSLNRYVYTLNDPVKYTDPIGLFIFDTTELVTLASAFLAGVLDGLSDIRDTRYISPAQWLQFGQEADKAFGYFALFFGLTLSGVKIFTNNQLTTPQKFLKFFITLLLGVIAYALGAAIAGGFLVIISPESGLLAAAIFVASLAMLSILTGVLMDFLGNELYILLSRYQ